MAEFSESSLWMKLAMMLVSAAFSMHLFSMDAPGWSSYTCSGWYGGNSGNNGQGNGNGNGNGNWNGNGNNGCGGSIQAVQALEVIGFLAVLTSLFLALCLVLLDELKGNKIALICLIIFAFIAGLFIIIGIAVYEGTSRPGGTSNPTACASCLGIVAGICALAGGVFCILEIVGVGAGKS